MSQHGRGAGGAHPVGVVDAVPAGQRRLHQRHGLEAHIRPAWCPAQMDMLIEQLAQPELLGQSRGQDEPSVGDQVVVIEGHRDPVQTVA
jgi:hypothetical protein